MKFSELIEQYVVQSEKDKVRHNSRDDYDLGPGWIFLGVGPVPTRTSDWTSVWGRIPEPLRTEIASRMCNGDIGSIMFIRWPNQQIHASAFAREGLGQWSCIVDDIPEDVAYIMKQTIPP